jgi:hypothetical protein
MKVLTLLTKPMETNNIPMKEVTRLLYCADDIYIDVKDERDKLTKKHKFGSGIGLS